jgi:hypothetical protein
VSPARGPQAPFKQCDSSAQVGISKLYLTFFDSVLDPEIPKCMLAFFDVSHVITQMLVTDVLFGLIVDSDCKSNVAECIKLCESLYTKGYRERLRTEMLAFYHLLRYLKRYEEGEKVSKKLTLFNWCVHNGRQG